MEDPGTMTVYDEVGLEDYRLPDEGAEAPTTTTQLSEQFPQIDTPLRVDPPASLKAPERVESLSRDQQIKADAFSPNAFSKSWSSKTLPPVSTKGMRKATINSSMKSYSQNQAPSANAVADSAMLAFSSQRSGRVQMEGQSYLNMAISHDNTQRYPEAMEAYRKFLAVSRKLGDAAAEGLACNCLGVDAMLLACPPVEGSPFDQRRPLLDDAKAMLARAVEFHTGHLAVADEGGRFVASTNLGLCHGLLGDLAVATTHHQEALRVAIRLQSYSGQAVAVGNLGLVALRQGDNSTASACLEQHLQLAQSLKDKAAECAAWSHLGALACQSGDLGVAVECFEGAAAIAEEQGEMALLKRITCDIGVARGKQTMAVHMQKLTRFARKGYAGGAAEDP